MFLSGRLPLELRRYCAITEKGLRALEEKEKEWNAFSKAVTAILAGA